MADEAAELAPVAGLLPHLAQGGLLERLPGIELALRKGPVLAPGTVHHGNLSGARGAEAEGEAPGRPDHVRGLVRLERRRATTSHARHTTGGHRRGGDGASSGAAATIGRGGRGIRVPPAGRGRRWGR